MNDHRTGWRVSALLLVVGLVLGACSSSGDGASDTTVASTAASSETADGTDDASDAPLTVVVTNDDGIGAPGIDALTSAISELDGVEVFVVAPAENQSASGDKTTSGEVAYADGETASGVAGTAVDGYPADTIGVALDDLDIEADLVASGINEGQNVGPLVQASGTVGAAMTAVRRGIPAVAGSAGLGDGADYEDAADLVVDWIITNRAALADGTQPTDGLVNINVPDCTVGSPRGIELVNTADYDQIPEGMSPFSADCEAELDFETPENDVQAVANGFIAISKVPVTDATDTDNTADPNDS